MKKDYSDIKIKFGRHLQKLREKKKLSLRDLAANCDLDSSNISKIERGMFNITLATIVELSKGLELQPYELLKVDFD